MTYILFNPLANNGHGTEGLDKPIAAVRSSGAEPQLMDLTAMDARAFLSALAVDDRVILCGGDGTLHHLINDLDGFVPAAPIYVWKFGTGNDFLRDVKSRSAGSLTLLNDYIHDLPQAEINGRRSRFLNNVSFGLDGQVCELGEQEKARLGKKVSYIPLALRLAAREYRMVNASVTVDGETRTYERVWVASAFNGRYIGGGLMLAPDQDRLSDKLCCVVFGGAGRAYILSRLPLVLWGGHVKLPTCDVRFGNDIRVSFDSPAALNMDGEVVSGVTDYHAWK